MTESRTDSERLDYDLAYRGESELGERVPWDIPGPQPAYVELERTGLIRGTVLDCGCGTGENALFLADKGYTVTGFDLAPTAISRALQKAEQRGLDVPFKVADALDMSGYEDSFDTVIDSGVAHVFTHEELSRYAAALHRVCRTGATVHVLGINEHRAFQSQLAGAVAELGGDAPEPGDRPLPMITAEALHDAFTEGWTVESIVETPMHALLPFTGTPIEVPGLLARFSRQ